jgi:hypothetical protein
VLGAHNAERGAGHGVIEPQHDVAVFHLAALLEENLSDHAAGWVLDFLDIGFDHERARCDHRAGQLRGCCPTADSAN